jgi:hypothetical protein
MAVHLTKGHLSSGIGSDSIQMLFGARCLEGNLYLPLRLDNHF